MEKDIRIVILQRGWVVVGEYSRDGEMVSIEKASVIRRWGTTRGLGQLAADGPTSSTTLDACGHVETHILAVVASISCDPTKWPHA